MNLYKRFIIFSLLLSFVFLGFLFALLYVYDPLQIYHKPYFREVAFSDDMRVQDKGIIKNYDFDSFILGTSMLENTSAKEADEKIGGKWVNISMSGSTFNERAVVLYYLLKKKPNARRIIYSIDLTIFLNTSDNNTANFDFLYDNNELNDMKIYINSRYIMCALSFSSNEKCIGNTNLEDLIKWSKKQKNNSFFGAFSNWLKHFNTLMTRDAVEYLKTTSTFYFQIQPFTDSIKANEDYIQTYLLDIIKQHPQTQFDLIIPPYSRLFYRVEKPSAFYEKASIFYAKARVILKWLVNKTQHYPNIKIYGFDDLDYADNLANYKDTGHHNADMNSMQLDAIANGTHILTPENIDEYLQTMENKIKAYDLAPLIKEIKEWEQNLSKTQ